jgi:hypothetical protein
MKLRQTSGLMTRIISQGDSKLWSECHLKTSETNSDNTPTLEVDSIEAGSSPDIS